MILTILKIIFILLLVFFGMMAFLAIMVVLASGRNRDNDDYFELDETNTLIEKKHEKKNQIKKE